MRPALYMYQHRKCADPPDITNKWIHFFRVQFSRDYGVK